MLPRLLPVFISSIGSTTRRAGLSSSVRLLHISMTTSAPKRVLRGLVFDMDGTLTVPNLDFAEMYRRCGVDMSKDLLTEVDAMTPEARALAQAAIEEIEEEGRRTMQLMPGACELARSEVEMKLTSTVKRYKWIKGYGLPIAVVSRNTENSARVLSERLWAPLLGTNIGDTPPFALLIGRDTVPMLPAKPDPAALLFIASKWRVPISEIIMIGDSVANDIVSGTRAGSPTALLDTGRRYAEVQAGKGTPGGVVPDVVVDSLLELPAALEAKFQIMKC